MIERLTGAAAAARSAEIARVLAAAFDAPSQRWSAASVAGTLGIPGTTALIAPDGCALVRTAADEAELLTIAVMPAARRRGTGAALLGACIETATAAGATTLHLEASAANAPALALYRRAGFSETGRRPGYYSGPSGCEDAVLMALDLA